MKGICLTTLGVLILSFDGLLIRLISVEAFDLLFWRGLLMSLMVLAILLLRKPNASLLPRDAAALRSSFFLCISTITFVVTRSLRLLQSAASSCMKRGGHPATRARTSSNAPR